MTTKKQEARPASANLRFGMTTKSQTSFRLVVDMHEAIPSTMQAAVYRAVDDVQTETTREHGDEEPSGRLRARDERVDQAPDQSEIVHECAERHRADDQPDGVQHAVHAAP